MPTLRLRSDGFLLIRGAHRLSDEAHTAVASAMQDRVNARWNISCSRQIAEELREWFVGCEQHASAWRSQEWKAMACHAAQRMIDQALQDETR